MKYNFYVSCRSLILALTAILTLLSQVNVSQGLECYSCVFVENDPQNETESSATCEKNPTSDDLVNVTRSSLSSPAVIQLFNLMSASLGIPVANALNSSTVTNLNQGISVLDKNTEATYIYCALFKFNHKKFGRCIIRGYVEATKDMGDTYCDDSLPPGEDVDPSEFSDLNSCHCRSSGCNGKDISRAN